MASELFGKANDEFIDENYRKALELYTEAIQLDDKRDDIYCNRAQTFLKLEKYQEAVNDASQALKINPNNVKAFFRQGMALFYLGDYTSAKEAFVKGQTLDAGDGNFATWIRKCEAECDLQNGSQSHADVGVSNTPAPSHEQEKAASSISAVPSVQQPSAPVKEQSRHSWYQTQTHVVVDVMLKNVQSDQLDLQIEDRSLSVTVKMATGSDYNLELDLSHPIFAQQSSYKIMKTKIEIKLKKQEGIQWTKLEGEEPTNIKQIQVKDDGNAAHTYPSSSHYTRNWDKLAQEVTEEEKNEKKEGDAALNDLFQKIYADGTPETKKAMMKSFYESGGTVLSTNWNEIGDKKTDIKPPDGMEFKKWDS